MAGLEGVLELTWPVVGRVSLDSDMVTVLGVWANVVVGGLVLVGLPAEQTSIHLG